MFSGLSGCVHEAWLWFVFQEAVLTFLILVLEQGYHTCTCMCVFTKYPVSLWGAVDKKQEIKLQWSYMY